MCIIAGTCGVFCQYAQTSWATKIAEGLNLLHPFACWHLAVCRSSSHLAEAGEGLSEGRTCDYYPRETQAGLRLASLPLDSCNDHKPGKGREHHPWTLDLCPRIAAVAEPAGITTIWGL